MTARAVSHETTSPVLRTRSGYSLDGGMTESSLAIEGDLLRVQP